MQAADAVAAIEAVAPVLGALLAVGQTVYMMGQGGRPFPVFVRSIEDGVATFDMNHELAGQDLNFEITLVEVAD